MLPYYCVFQNGQSIPADAAEFRLHDTLAVFNAAPRVFTSFLARRRNAEQPFEVSGFRLHLERLLADARAFDLVRPGAKEFDPDCIFDQLRAVLRSTVLQLPNELTVRLVAAKDALALYIERFVRRWPASVPVALRSFSGLRPFPLHKTTATEVCRRSHAAAEASNAQEGLLIDDNRKIAEGSWSNVFWFDWSGELYTRSDSVLPGVTRQLLLDNYPVQFAAPTLEQLRDQASEMFIAQSSHGISPVSSIDNVPIGNSVPGDFTRKLLDAWAQIETRNLTAFA